jgi:type IV pilus assembly protein PilA
MYGARGYTFVEVLVVAVIVAVLAAVAIPLYLNSVTASHNQVAQNTAGGIATFCAACQNGGGTVSGISTTPTAGITITCTGGSGGGTTMTVPASLQASATGTTSPSTVSVINTASGSTTQTSNF